MSGFFKSFHFFCFFLSLFFSSFGFGGEFFSSKLIVLDFLCLSSKSSFFFLSSYFGESFLFSLVSSCGIGSSSGCSIGGSFFLLSFSLCFRLVGCGLLGMCLLP